MRFIGALEAAGFAFKSTLVWVKNQFVIGMSDYHFRHELILYGWLQNGAHLWNGDRSQDSVFDVDTAPCERFASDHKTSRIDRSHDGEQQPARRARLRPFLRQRFNYRRRASTRAVLAYGCEIDPSYVAVTLERLSLLGLKPELVDK